MDALSEVLATLKVSGAISSRFHGSGSWAFRFPAYQHIKFGCVLNGRFLLWLEANPQPVRLEEGDFYMLTTGEPFCSASDVRRLPVDGPAAYRLIRDKDGIVQCQGEDRDGLSPVSLASGRFTFEDDLSSTLLDHLPPMIHLNAHEVRESALPHLVALLRGETGAMLPGTEVARSSLAALVLVNVLRNYLKRMPAPAGWLGALSDERIGGALALIHNQPNERWTLDDLALRVGMSRTAFATQFRRHVGHSPIDYLNRWRMAIARSSLRHSDDSLMRIAERLGYLSDTAFSIAFKRATGISPGRFRSASRETLRS